MSLTKAIKKSQLLKTGYEHLLRREIEIQSNLRSKAFTLSKCSSYVCHRHINILRMYGFFYDEKRVYIILEYAPGGESYKALCARGRFSENTTARYAFYSTGFRIKEADIFATYRRLFTTAMKSISSTETLSPRISS